MRCKDNNNSLSVKKTSVLFCILLDLAYLCTQYLTKKIRKDNR